ncbi:MAG: hypothetical protein P1P64_03275 [Treponemataceae bacterium]
MKKRILIGLFVLLYVSNIFGQKLGEKVYKEFTVKRETTNKWVVLVCI